MIGTRGIRLGVLRPALYPMQVRAICRAAAARITQGGSPRVDILIPMVMDPTEMVIARSWVADAMAATATAPNGKPVEWKPTRAGLGAAVDADATLEAARAVGQGDTAVTRIASWFHGRGGGSAEILH